MAKTVTITTAENLNWPSCCAKCRSRNNLTWASATSGRVTSVAPTLTGAVRIKSELLDLSYPVCDAHTKGIGFANFLTRNTSGIKMLRGFVYLIGPISLLVIAIFFMRLMTQRQSKVEMPVGMMALFIFGAIALVSIVRAYRTLPLRISKQTEDFVSIKFNDNLYANEFVKLNRQHVIDN